MKKGKWEIMRYSQKNGYDLAGQDVDDGYSFEDLKDLRELIGDVIEKFEEEWPCSKGPGLCSNKICNSNKPLSEKELVSKCCHEPVAIAGDERGTRYYICSQCLKACDTKSYSEMIGDEDELLEPEYESQPLTEGDGEEFPLNNVVGLPIGEDVIVRLEDGRIIEGTIKTRTQQESNKEEVRMGATGKPPFGLYEEPSKKEEEVPQKILINGDIIGICKKGFRVTKEECIGCERGVKHVCIPEPSKKEVTTKKEENCGELSKSPQELCYEGICPGEGKCDAVTKGWPHRHKRNGDWIYSRIEGKETFKPVQEPSKKPSERIDEFFDLTEKDRNWNGRWIVAIMEYLDELHNQGKI